MAATSSSSVGGGGGTVFVGDCPQTRRCAQHNDGGGGWRGRGGVGEGVDRWRRRGGEGGGRSTEGRITISVGLSSVGSSHLLPCCPDMQEPALRTPATRGHFKTGRWA